MTLDITRDTPLRHICEGCGKEEILTPNEAYEAGWDYPPLMGAFKTVSPRTCSNCPISVTVWWRIVTSPDPNSIEYTDKDKEVLIRITNEPESIIPKDE